MTVTGGELPNAQRIRRRDEQYGVFIQEQLIGTYIPSFGTYRTCVLRVGTKLYRSRNDTEDQNAKR